MFREDTTHGNDEPTDVQVILSSTVSEIKKLFRGVFTPRLLYWKQELHF